jgi:hypothetical protein
VFRLVHNISHPVPLIPPTATAWLLHTCLFFSCICPQFTCVVNEIPVHCCIQFTSVCSIACEANTGYEKMSRISFNSLVYETRGKP